MDPVIGFKLLKNDELDNGMQEELYNYDTPNSNDQTNNNLKLEIGAVHGAGILCYSIPPDRNEVYFLLGKEAGLVKCNNENFKL